VVNRPSVPEIITVNSELLQTQIRDLLPSQNGFGSELQATNVITPIIDLTAAAEGSTVGSNLQTAIAFGSQSAFNVVNTTTVLLSSPGFYRIFGTSCTSNYASNTAHCRFSMSDGLATKVVWGQDFAGANSDATTHIQFDFVVFLAAGESISAEANTANSVLTGSTRQIATGDGTLVNPSGFPL
jgi:hypothetical protein|tara:strand:+ start:1512 stop:2063 length:552 start_codon:yes stop_codon:yes gene_type:complete